MKELKARAEAPAACPLCGRPNHKPSDHHLVPKARGGKVTETICQDCHTAIHKTFSNKELAREYATIEALLSHAEFAKLVQFIAGQDGRVKTRLHRSQRGRRGSG